MCIRDRFTPSMAEMRPPVTAGPRCRAFIVPKVADDICANTCSVYKEMKSIRNDFFILDFKLNGLDYFDLLISNIF